MTLIRPRSAVVAFSFVSILAGGYWLGATRLAHAQTSDPASEHFSINDLAFFAGHWRGELFGGRSEEAWFAPEAGTMLGTFRLMFGDDTRVVEYLMITESEEGVVYRFKHFNLDYTTWEDEQPLIFDLIEISENRAVFESKVQTQPKRLTYSIRDDGKLSVLVEGEDDGKQESFEALFARVEN